MGKRTIAPQMVRSGIQISRRAVQRILRESKPKKPKKAKKRWPKLNPAQGVEPYHLLTPSNPNQTWHMDIMTFRVLWVTYSVVAILDGATRKLLCLRAYRSKALNSQQMVQLVKATTVKHGTPSHLITDHGVQFRNIFKLGLKSLGIKHVRGQVRKQSGHPCRRGPDRRPRRQYPARCGNDFDHACANEPCVAYAGRLAIE